MGTGRARGQQASGVARAFLAVLERTSNYDCTMSYVGSGAGSRYIVNVQLHVVIKRAAGGSASIGHGAGQCAMDH